MKYFLTTLLSCTLLMTACSASSADNTHDIGKLRVSDVWAKATPPQARVAGGYLSVQNRGDAADKLLRVESAVAASVEIHEMSDVGGVARMREVTNGVELPAGSTTTLKPGGYHLMLMNLKQPLAAGQHVPVTLSVQDAQGAKSTLSIQAPVMLAPAGGASAPAHRH